MRTGSLQALSRVYAIAALVMAGVFSPLAYIPIPLLLLALSLYLWFRGEQWPLRLPFSLLLMLALPLLFQSLAGTWASLVFALPLLPLLDYSLRESALLYDFGPAVKARRPTRRGLWLGLSLAAVGVVAVILGSWNLLLSCGLVVLYLAGASTLALLRMSRVPIEAEVVSYRVVAGNLGKATVKLLNRSRLGGQVSLRSPYGWLQMQPQRLVLDRPVKEVELAFTPPLAGAWRPEIRAAFVDPWGLVQMGFGLEMVQLVVIPRARYAEWLARRYLEMTRAGTWEMATFSTSPKAGRLSRKGIEYYGLRSYQPGDSFKAIDWKHTLKFQEVIVKEFLDSPTRYAVVAANLSACDEEEKDKLASGIILTTLTLARENISAILAAYDSERVLSVTPLLHPREALLQALALVQEVRIVLHPLRYLQAPDVLKLRANIQRLRQAHLEAATKLADVLDLEYRALSAAARDSPATEALSAALSRVKDKVNVLFVSACNHDAEAIALNQFMLRGKGYDVMQVDLDRQV